MNKLLLCGAAAMLAFASAPSMAQPAPPAGVAQGTAPGAPPLQQVHVRVMSDKVMTRAEVADHVRKLFARFDANHDGYITRDEIASAAHGMMAMHGEMQHSGAHAGMMGDRNALFDRLDTNHDGSISRQEFVAGHANMVEHRMIVMRRTGSAAAGEPSMPGMNGMHGMRMHGMAGFGAHLFDMADANHDGRVSLEEAETAALAHFDRADLNHDGKLTPEERQQAHQLMRQHRPS